MKRLDKFILYSFMVIGVCILITYCTTKFGDHQNQSLSTYYPDYNAGYVVEERDDGLKRLVGDITKVDQYGNCQYDLWDESEILSWEEIERTMNE